MSTEPTSEPQAAELVSETASTTMVSEETSTTQANPVPELAAAPVPEASAAPVPEASAAPVPEASAAPVPEASAAPVPEASAAPVPQVTSESAEPSEASDSSADNKSRVAIGSQRGGTSTEPKAVAQAKANPISMGNEEVTPDVSAPEVRSSLGLDGQEVDLNLDDAALGDLMGGGTLNPGQVDELVVDQKYQGKVVRLNEENVFLLINGRFDGIVATRTFKKKPAEGDLIEVVVTRHNTEEGLYELRIPGGAIDAVAWDDLTVGAMLEVKVTGSNTGGLECIVNGIRGFVPGGQIDLARVENFGDYVGKKMELRIIEVDKKKKKLILSRKAILEEAQKETQQEFLKTVEQGAYFDGTVTRLMDFGAFINIGSGVEGLAHVSKLSWDHIKHPKDAVAVGQSVRVKVDKINAENGKISLSVKDTMTDPWFGIAERYPDGSVVKGTVTKLADFGAFVSLELGIEGMVHISELAHGRVSTVQSVVKVGDEIDVKVLSIEIKKRRIALSRKATLDAPLDNSRANAKPAVEEKVREMAVKPTKDSLKGGRGKSSGGEQFGLRW